MCLERGRLRGLIACSWALIVAAALAATVQAQEGFPKILSNEFLTPTPVPRLALVVGAEHYERIAPVPNALNDAAEIVKALGKAGFSSVRLLPDPKGDDVYDYVAELAHWAGGPNKPVIVVFFFAGHGFQNDAYNYIVPVEARNDHLVDDSIPVINILSKLATHQAGLAIFLFDSCRTGVPLTSSNTTNGRLINPVGFASLAAPKGAILGLAAEFGFPARSAAIEGDADSPYTTALMTYIPHETLSLAQMLDKVRTFVQRRTHDTQSPFEVKGANDTGFYFIPTQSQQDAETQAWRAVLETDRADCVQSYIKNHPGSSFLKVALDWVTADLQQTSTHGEKVCPEE